MDLIDELRAFVATAQSGSFTAGAAQIGISNRLTSKYVAELEADAQRGGFAAALAITAPTADIADAYAMSDMVLQLSRKPETFGRTVIEALSVGVPIAGWAHGGVGELLRELQPEGAVPPFDIDELARRVIAMLQHPPAPPATMPYTLQAMQDATLAVYDELA